jgi:glutamine amidotransferase
MGWNSLDVKENSQIFPEELDGTWGYFANSYFCPVVTETVVTAEHGTTFSAIVERKNIFGVQFHPEKSAALGERIVRSFVDLPC